MAIGGGFLGVEVGVVMVDEIGVLRAGVRDGGGGRFLGVEGILAFTVGLSGNRTRFYLPHQRYIQFDCRSILC